MPWKYKSMTLREGRAWTDDEGYQHPKNWAMWDTPTKTSRVLVWEDEAAPFDNKFYSGRDADGTLIEKSLTDTLWVDADGNAVVDEMTGAQGVTDGLKNKYIKETKQIANNLLPLQIGWLLEKLKIALKHLHQNTQLIGRQSAQLAPQ